MTIISIQDILLGISAFFTSTVAATVGLGGGMLLITIMPMLMPTAAIIPVHGTTQLARAC